MIRATLAATALAAVLASSAPMWARNAACWGDETRQDISCAAITERLLLDLRGRDEAAVRKAMDAPGRMIGDGLHFLSNYSRGKRDGSGDLNVIFLGGRAVSIFATVDKANSDGHQNFIWSAYEAPPLGREIDRSTAHFTRKPFCSDLSNSADRCSVAGNMDTELTKMQMQGNLSKAELLQSLKAACTPRQSLAVSDPAGDCDRLRRRLQ